MSDLKIDVNNLKIDIIIPAYNAQKTLPRCLSSIAMQTIIDDIKVTVVDDASTDSDYSEIMNTFSKLMDIQLLRYEENGGPGVARQYGIDHTSNPLMMFADADDTFNGAFSIQQLRDIVRDNPNCMAVWSKFTEETTAGSLIEHEIAPVWMFGKIYKREFWERNGIRFHPKSRYNEDTGVNSMIYLLKKKEGNDILLYANTLNTYNWHNNKNTITKTNNNAQFYWDDRGFYGFVQNRLWTVAHVISKISKEDESSFNGYLLEGLVYMYIYYNSAKNNKSYLLKDIAKGIILYYNRYVAWLIPFLEENRAAEMLKKCMANSNPIMYNMTWHDFIDKVHYGVLGLEPEIDEFSKYEMPEEYMYPEYYIEQE